MNEQHRKRVRLPSGESYSHTFVRAGLDRRFDTVQELFDGKGARQLAFVRVFLDGEPHGDFEVKRP